VKVVLQNVACFCQRDPCVVEVGSLKSRVSVKGTLV
jgi:hypothetical protein